jgi:hypothetical protein
VFEQKTNYGELEQIYISERHLKNQFGATRCKLLKPHSSGFQPKLKNGYLAFALINGIAFFK